MKNQTKGEKNFDTEQNFSGMIPSFLLNCNIMAMTPNVGLSNVFPPSFTLECAYLDLIIKIV